MNVLIIGVSGFIGNHLYHALCQLGHHVIGASRNKVANINWQEFNFKETQAKLRENLQGIDIVINAAGIYRQNHMNTFLQVHTAGAINLFEACEKENIRVIQISAIGAEKHRPTTEFLQSKRSADQYLLNSKIPHSVLYPGIVLGEGGKSTQQLSSLARLLCRPMVFGRDTQLPLISIYQLSQCIVDIINHPESQAVAKVLIASPETTENLLNNLQTWQRADKKLNRGKGCFIYIPRLLISCAFKCFPTLVIGAFNKQSINMLEDFSETNYDPVSQETASSSLLKNRASENFIKTIKLNILYYINLIILSVIWLMSGASSLINIEQSRDLITPIGLQPGFGDMLIVTGAVVDLLLGVLLWVPRIRTWVIYLQITFMFAYSLIISVFLPIYWLHPFAPVVKNLAMFVLALYLLTDKRSK